MIEIKLWDRPQLAKSFFQHQGKNLDRLIREEPGVVLYHVKYKGWQLSELAKGLMPKKVKA